MPRETDSVFKIQIYFPNWNIVAYVYTNLWNKYVIYNYELLFSFRSRLKRNTSITSSSLSNEDKIHFANEAFSASSSWKKPLIADLSHMRSQLISGSADLATKLTSNFNGAMNILDMPSHVAKFFPTIRASRNAATGGHSLACWRGSV